MKKTEFPILIAEDDPVTRTLIKKCLGKEGLDVVCVENGFLALEQFRDRFYPIVLSDWMMPKIDGLQLCRELRNIKSQGYVFFILLTSKSDINDIVAGLEAGADDYLTKPFHPAELIARISTGMRILELEHSLKSANEEIRILSITDPLTGCYNRTYMVEQLNNEIKRTRRYRHCLSLVMVDIDHFKHVNDQYGHLTGDLVLKKLAAILKDTIRQDIDWVLRYGGEEFILVLPETDGQGAEALAERLRDHIATQSFDLNHHQFSITASFGIACITPETPPDQCTMETIINRADGMLYRSKRNGRNRVYLEIL